MSYLSCIRNTLKVIRALTVSFLDFLDLRFRLGNRADEFCSHLSTQGQSYNPSIDVVF